MPAPAEGHPCRVPRPRHRHGRHHPCELVLGLWTVTGRGKAVDGNGAAHSFPTALGNRRTDAASHTAHRPRRSTSLHIGHTEIERPPGRSAGARGSCDGLRDRGRNPGPARPSTAPTGPRTTLSVRTRTEPTNPLPGRSFRGSGSKWLDDATTGQVPKWLDRPRGDVRATYRGPAARSGPVERPSWHHRVHRGLPRAKPRHGCWKNVQAR
jgi:hypothetical protein